MNQPAKQVNFSAADAQPAAEPRIYGIFPAQVRGIDPSGEPFHTLALIDSFSATEFDLRLSRPVEAGEQLLVVADIHEATVALHGTVARAETQHGGAHLLTIAITHYRFMKEPHPARPA